MTKAAALYDFWASFGWTTFATQAEAGTAFPYLVYEPNIGAIDDGPVPIDVNLWDYGQSETTINAKTQEIADKISLGGIYIPCDGGAILIQRASPFSQKMTDQASDYIRGRLLHVTAEYLTQD